MATQPPPAPQPSEEAQPPASPAKPVVPTITQRSQVDGVVVARLSNGLTAIVQASGLSPVVTVRAYVRAGGLYESPWLGCGLSHLLEHLVADDATHESQGGRQAKAKKTPGGANRVTKIGGQANAYTSLAHTCYHISAAAGKTDECIDLVADWLARPKFTEEDFEREHGVVQRELEKGKDEPGRQMWYAHARNVFGPHPAAVPVIGFAEPLRGVTWSDLQAYYRRMYVPQNMVFAVVGDVDPPAVLQRIRRAFAGFEAGRVPDLSLPAVRPFTGVRRVTQLYKNLKEVIANVSFQSIPLLHEDLYALDVLAYVLSQGRSSRLYRALVEKQKLVSSVSCSSWTPQWGRGVFTVRYRSRPDKADAAEAAILAILKEVVANGVDSAELDRAKRQKVADLVYARQKVESIAGTLATDYMSTGDVLFSKNYTQRIQDVTTGQVLAAAKRYLTFDKMAVTRLAPKAAAVAASSAPAGGKRDKKEVFSVGDSLRVILQPSESTGLVSMAYVVRGGVLAESNETNGLGTLMAGLTTRGTKNHTAEQIAEFFDNAGGGISGKCGNNSFYWQATVLDDQHDKALEIFLEAIVEPTFDQKQLEILRPLSLAQIRRVDQHWSTQLRKYFRERFFGGESYSRQSMGTEDVVSGADVERIRRFHQQRVQAAPGVLAVYGRFDPAAVRRRIEQRFATAGPAGAADLALPDARSVPSEGQWHILKTDKKQAGIMVAVPGMRLDNLEDRFAINVMDTIISGYRLPSGWLHDELRGKQLVYVVHAYNWPGLAPGAFVTYAGCQPEEARKVVDIIHANLRKAASYRPTQEEIDLAVNTILTADLLGKQKLSDLAMDAALDELYGLGHDFRQKMEKYYRSVTPDDVLRVAGKYLGGGYVTVVTTPRPELLGKESPAATPQPASQE